MATFSQFKSKYITERRSKNIGDEGTKNIVKKLLGQDAIPDDGGKKGQARIERELGLNKPNNTNKSNTNKTNIRVNTNRNNTNKNKIRVNRNNNVKVNTNRSNVKTKVNRRKPR